MSSWRNLEFIFAIAVLISSSPVQCQTSGSVVVDPTEKSIEEGTNFNFTCSGPPGGIIEWYHTDSSPVNKLVNNEKYRIETVFDNSSSYSILVIIAASPDQSGSYDCRLSNSDSNFVATLTVYPIKDVQIEPAMPEFHEGGNLYLNCTVNDMTDQAIEWVFNNGAENTTLSGGDENSHIQVFPNGSLAIRALVPTDAGIYMCKHTFTDGSKTYQVFLGGDITLTAEKSVKFTEGDRALIKCEAHVITTALLPTFSWLIDGEQWDAMCQNRCKIETKSTTHTVTSQLEINKITMEDRLNYTCIATNAATEVSKNVLLRVRDRLAALWPFLGIVCEVILLIIIIFIHEKCSQGEDIGEEDEDEDVIKKEKIQNNDGDSEMRKRSSKQ